MKKFAKNIAMKIIGSDYVRVTQKGNYTCLSWGKSMSNFGHGYVYLLSWDTHDDGSVEWTERDQDYNIKENTGMTCICDQINLDGDGLFITIDELEAEKEKILDAAAKIYAEQEEKNKALEIINSAKTKEEAMELLKSEFGSKQPKLDIKCWFAYNNLPKKAGN